MPPPTLRLPTGGYLAAAMAVRACSTVSTHGDYDPPSSRIQHAFDVVMVALGDPRQRHAAGICDGGEDRRGLAPVDGRVFDVQSQPIKTPIALRRD